MKIVKGFRTDTLDRSREVCFTERERERERERETNDFIRTRREG